MASRADIAAGKAFVTLYVKNNPLMQGLQAAGKSMVQLGGFAQNIGKWMTVAGTSIVSAMIAAAHHFATAGDTIAKMSERTGIGTNALSELGYAAEQSGSNLEELEGGIAKLQRVIADAAGGSESANEKLLALGTSFEALNGLSADEQLELVADGLRGIEDPGKRADAIMDAMGKSATKFLPLFSDGAKGIRALREEARQLGLSMDPASAAAAVELGDAWDRVKKVIGAAVFAIGGALAPTLTSVLGTIKTFAVGIQRWIVDNQELVRTVAKVGIALAVTGSVIGGIGTIMVGVGAAIPIVVSAFTNLVLAVGAVTTALGSMFAVATSVPVLVVGALAAAAAWLVFSDSGREAVGMVRDAFAKLPGIIGGVIAKITDGVRSFGAMIGGLVSRGVDIAVSAFASMRARVNSFIASLGSGMSSAITGALLPVRVGINLLGMLGNAARQVGLAMMTQLGQAAEGLSRMWNAAKSGAVSVAGSVSSTFSSIATTLSSIWSKVSLAFTSAFDRMKEIAGVTIDGIKDAFAGGDLTLAAQIGITGLKLAFVEGMSSLSTMIGGVMGDTIGTITSQLVGGDFAGAWATTVKSMGAVWAAWSEGVIKTFTGAATAILDFWRNTVSKISNFILQASAAGGVTGKVFSTVLGVDVKEEMERQKKLTADPAFMKTQRQLQTDLKQKLSIAVEAGDTAKIEQLKNQLNDVAVAIAKLSGMPPVDLLDMAGADVERQLDLTTAGIDAAIAAMNRDAEAGTKEASDALVTATAGGSQALNDLADQTLAELERLSALAKKKGDEARAKAAEKKTDLEPPEPPDFDEMRKRAEVTFSSAALINLGQGGGPQERIAKAVQDQIREVREHKEVGKRQLAALKTLKFQYG